MSSEHARKNADLIILGGGCAGLSLATHLAHARTSLEVVIVEPRASYHEDRTWCGWRLAPHAFDDCAVASWHSWQVATPAGPIERSSALYPYEMIRSDLFYDKALRAIAHHPTICLLKGLSALNTLTSTGGYVDVALSDGSTLAAPWVIDTRPSQRTISRPWLWQNFVGYVVKFNTVEGHDFSHTPVLMDFQAAGGSVAQFMYILPMGDHTFLCEWTQFAHVSGQFEEIDLRLRAWLNKRAGNGWTIERREQGSLPMAVTPRDRKGRIVPAGTRGGSMRASTGYAFHAIQRWAAACSASLQASGIPTAPQQDHLLESMDAIFLEVLQDPSISAAEIFRGLFEDSPPDSLVRFLAGMPRRGDLWPIMRGLPWARFLRAAPVALRSRTRTPNKEQPLIQPGSSVHSGTRT